MYESYALTLETLPFIVPSDFAGGIRVPTDDTSVDEVCQRNERQYRSYHRAPSFRLASNIDSHVTPQMLVRVLTLEIGFAGVNVSIVSFAEVIVGSDLGHDIISYSERVF